MRVRSGAWCRIQCHCRVLTACPVPRALGFSKVQCLERHPLRRAQEAATDAAKAEETRGGGAAAPGPDRGSSDAGGNDLATSAAKLVAEIVASPIFYLVAGGWLGG